ncbi:EAL domain-containing protein [Pseudoduganella sp. FT93W]|uniref:EAL domain-containing protein n=1 Tax=Duganella fentianensis TaxID=2692177 RepID=A0A845I1V8_9BURK|nr:EAL domain-containing protein [Duganella fentianensis]MYN45691.1 EAL domain-containing protein [Duganella fentianensis]
MAFRFRSLQSRIVTLFLVLVVAVQVVGLIVIQRGIDNNARQSISSELANGSKVFRRLLEQNAQSLRFGARLLTRDTAFVALVGNNDDSDRATIESALANSGARIKAALTMLVNGERQVSASTNPAQAAALEQQVLGMLDQAEAADGANGMAIIDRRPYQIVVMPVKAPITIAWVVMTFPIDWQLARDMREISGLDTTILTRDAAGSWLTVGTTLAPQLAQSLPARLQAQAGADGQPFDLTLGESRYGMRLLPVGQAGRQSTQVLLARSFDEATAEYVRLERWLIALTLGGIVISALAIVFTAKRITQPISALALTARRLEQGDYQQPVHSRRHDEIGALARAFDAMRAGIARREEEIRHLAYWDTLTSLPNRAQFLVLLNQALQQAQHQQQAVFVLMMDLDRFKHVNDVMGHSFGDALLQQVAQRLQTLLVRQHQAAQLARMGGDEFAVLLPAADLAAARQLAAAILRALETPLSLEDQTVDLGAGLGIAGYPAHAQDGETLLGMAEVAMYSAKLRNDGAVIYDAALDKGSAQSLSLLTELRHAIERDEFRLFVQPKIALKTGQVVGMEALVRWQHPQRGNVFPDAFIPFAEQTGFIRVLTRWVMERSARLCQELEQAGYHLKMSVNLSTRDLMDQDLPVKFGDMLQRHGQSPQSFCLEITESAIMDDPVRAQNTLALLSAMGFELSIDDFGTGYSSLAYLKSLPVNELKIDKSFVLNMETDLGDARIVQSTISLARAMHLRVVAEGIETETVWRLLEGMKCDQGQGYFMSRPIPAAQLEDWLAQWQSPLLEQRAAAE